MKLNISFSSFRKNHKLKKDQLIYRVKKCKDYKQVENIFNFLLVEKNSFIFESVEKGIIRGRYTIIGLNPDKIWDINKNIITEKFEGKIKTIKEKPLKFLNNLIHKFKTKLPRNIPSMSSMLVGYFSYDIIRYIENIPDHCIDDLGEHRHHWRDLISRSFSYWRRRYDLVIRINSKDLFKLLAGDCVCAGVSIAMAEISGRLVCISRCDIDGG